MVRMLLLAAALVLGGCIRTVSEDPLVVPPAARQKPVVEESGDGEKEEVPLVEINWSHSIDPDADGPPCEREGLGTQPNFYNR